MRVRSPHTQGGDLCLGKPHLGAPRRSAGSAGLEWSQRDLPPNLHMLRAVRGVVGPQTPTCMAAQGRPCLSNGAIGQPPQTAPGQSLPPQSALGWSHAREGAKGGRVRWDPMGQKPPCSQAPRRPSYPLALPAGQTPSATARARGPGAVGSAKGHSGFWAGRTGELSPGSFSRQSCVRP